MSEMKVILVVYRSTKLWDRFTDLPSLPENLRESPEMARDLQVSRNLKKIPGIEGIWLIYYFSARNPYFCRIFQNVCLYPRISLNVVLLLEMTENFCYYPPPPPPYLVGLRRTRKRKETQEIQQAKLGSSGFTTKLHSFSSDNENIVGFWSLFGVSLDHGLRL